MQSTGTTLDPSHWTRHSDPSLYRISPGSHVLSNSDNTTRALKQSISVDGWIATFNDEGVATVHVDVSFLEGRFGEDPQSKISFKVALKRVAIHVWVNDETPIKLVRHSVAYPKDDVSATQRMTSTSSAHIQGNVSAKLGGNSGAHLALDAGTDHQQKTATEIERLVTKHLERHYPGTKEGEHIWEFRANPDLCAVLDGKAWGDPANMPRFSVKKKDNHGNAEKPMVVVEVRCRREDMEISELKPKDTQRQAIWAKKSNRQKNLAAAEQIIKDELAAAGYLELPDMNEPYAEIRIADKFVFQDDD